MSINTLVLTSIKVHVQVNKYLVCFYFVISKTVSQRNNLVQRMTSLSLINNRKQKKNLLFWRFPTFPSVSTLHLVPYQSDTFKALVSFFMIMIEANILQTTGSFFHEPSATNQTCI